MQWHVTASHAAASRSCQCSGRLIPAAGRGQGPARDGRRPSPWVRHWTSQRPLALVVQMLDAGAGSRHCWKVFFLCTVTRAQKSLLGAFVPGGWYGYLVKLSRQPRQPPRRRGDFSRRPALLYSSVETRGPDPSSPYIPSSPCRINTKSKHHTQSTTSTTST